MLAHLAITSSPELIFFHCSKPGALSGKKTGQEGLRSECRGGGGEVTQEISSALFSMSAKFPVTASKPVKCSAKPASMRWMLENMGAETGRVHVFQKGKMSALGIRIRTELCMNNSACAHLYRDWREVFLQQHNRTTYKFGALQYKREAGKKSSSIHEWPTQTTLLAIIQGLLQGGLQTVPPPFTGKVVNKLSCSKIQVAKDQQRYPAWGSGSIIRDAFLDYVFSHSQWAKVGMFLRGGSY